MTEIISGNETRKKSGGDNVRPLTSKSTTDTKRAWTIKGIHPDTVERAREAAQQQGMLLSMWVEKQLKAAAQRDLGDTEAKAIAADALLTKIQNAESTILDYIRLQDKAISKIQDDLSALNNNIVPPLIKALSK